MKIVFWGKYIDTYLADTLKCFEESTGQPVRYLLVEETFTHRSIAGENPAVPASQVTLLEETGFHKHASRLLIEEKDAVHVFLSFWGDKRLFRVILRALRNGLKTAVIFEPYSTVPHGYWRDEGALRSNLKVTGRKIAYRLLWPVIRLVSGGNPPCVLAVSPLAEDQLRRVGFNSEMIYPFGYFVNQKEVEKSRQQMDRPLRILFSGSLIKRKGLDIAISAVERINATSINVMLDVFGAGDISRFLPREIAGIRYLGTYPQSEAQAVISGYDLLVVPSRHEGWGLVVNEALMQGVPVIASDRVGAKCLLENSGAGWVFRSMDISQLKSLILSLVENRYILEKMSSACSRIKECITPLRGAAYLNDVLMYHFTREVARPRPHWLDELMEQ